MKFNKLGLLFSGFKTELLIIFILLCSFVFVIATTNIGIEMTSPSDFYEDDDCVIDNNTQITFLGTNTSLEYFDNWTLYYNESLFPTKNANVMNVGVTAVNNVNDYFNTSGTSNGYNWSLADFYGITGAIGSNSYIHYNIYACDNNSECIWSANRSIYCMQTTLPGRTPPSVTLEYPADGATDDDGFVEFNVSATDSVNLFNISIISTIMNTTYLTDNNITPPNNLSGDAPAITWTENGTTASGLLNSIVLNSDQIWDANRSDGDIIFWYGRACNNATTGAGNCTDSENRTVNIIYTAAETTKPVITINSPLNGTFDSDGTITINFTATDNIALQNATLYWNKSYASYDKDTVVYVVNNSLALGGGTSNDTATFEFVDQLDPTSITELESVNNSDGFLNFYIDVCDTKANCQISNNYTLEIDRTGAVVSNLFNVSKVRTHSTVLINMSTNEESNITLWFGYNDTLWDVRESTSINGLLHTFEFGNLESDHIYSYNYSVTNIHENTTDYSDLNTYQHPLSLMTGVTWIGITSNNTNVSSIITDTNATYIYGWSQGTGNWTVYLRDAPELSDNFGLQDRGTGLGIQMDYDTTWLRVNGTIFNSTLPVITINKTTTTGWNLVGILDDGNGFNKNPNGILYTQFPEFNDNISIMSWQNLTDHSYFDAITNRTRNVNQTFIPQDGLGVWMLATDNFYLNRTGGPCFNSTIFDESGVCKGN